MRDSSADCVLYKDRNKREPAQGVWTLNGAKQKPFSAIFVVFLGLTVGGATLIRPPFLQMDLNLNPASAESG
jgi:hypothetical protein